ncbi:MAG: hypothetical protein JWM59_3108 [Verrucomicrobiales bacterium]|nr:hypothetical protein [Verrucomicrobiales bacterium]
MNSSSPTTVMHATPDTSTQECRDLDLLMPLAFFYVRQELELPALEFIEGKLMPEPSRHLLVHQSDMTPRLRNFHHTVPALTVVAVEKTEDFVMREVILTDQERVRPIEYGAIGIHLEGLPSHVKTMIRDGVAPLGAILESEGIPHASAPTGYFRLFADDRMSRLLNTSKGTVLHGRCNVLTHPDGSTLADIVEVLPPG